jgi:hypothetical protein
VKSIGLIALLSACSWSAFDDLKDDTWVHATDKPENASSNWGIAIQRGQATGTGGRVVVIGANQSLYSELAAASNGDVSVPETTIELSSMFGIGTLDPQPLLIADPASNEVALVTSSGASSVATLHGSAGMMNVHQVIGPATVDAATYMVATMGGPSQTLIGEGDKVFGTFFANPPPTQPSCKLVDDAAMPVAVKALGATPHPSGDGRHNVLVWSANGKLLRFPPDIFNGTPVTCATGLAPGANAAIATSFMPAKGSQILTFESDGNRFALLQGHTDTGSGFLALYDVTTAITMVGSPQTVNGIKQAALMETGGKRYVVAGFPDAIVDGTTGAGQVQVFEVDTTAGVSGTSVMTLHDAQPEDSQAFGRSVTVTPFDGKPIIVVAADNEVFTYFRTQLYDETRAR